MARDAALTPIVAMRGSDGMVRAFRNACRHRGVQLVDGDRMQEGADLPLSRLDLRARRPLARRSRTSTDFPGLDKSTHGLVPVTTVEKHGMVFVTQDAQGALTPRIDVVPDCFGPEWRLLSTDEQEFDFNWKMFVDGLLEGYHIRSTHAETFYPRQYDNINVVELLRTQQPRQLSRTAASRNSATCRPPSARPVGALTQLYHLFPNVSVATFPTHMTMAVLEPLTVDRTRLVTYTLSNRDDQAMARSRRAGISSRRAPPRIGKWPMPSSADLPPAPTTSFTFGLFEGAIRHFHRNLAAALAKP